MSLPAPVSSDLVQAEQNEPQELVEQSLFPDASEVMASAFSTLRDLDMSRSRAYLERVRALDPKAVNLATIDEALELLERVLGSEPPTPRGLADVFAAVSAESRAGRLGRATAQFVDETIARYHRRHGSPSEFIDEEARLHRGVLDLALDNPLTARRHLAGSLDGSHRHRADLWGYQGDAAFALGRMDEAHACYVRGLLLEASDVDLLRCRMGALVRCYEGLCRQYPEDCARELLLVHAWLEDLLKIPPKNGWLEQAEIEGYADPEAAPRERFRYFKRLLYWDQSLPLGRVSIARREEMAELDGPLFDSYMRKCRSLDGTS